MSAEARRLKATWLALRATERLTPRLAGRVAGRLWFTPWQAPRSEHAQARERRWLAGTTPKSWSVEGRELAGFEAGAGPSILLVHGWADRASSLGAFIQPLIGAGFRVVSLDLPAHGASPGKETDAIQVAAAVTAVAERSGGLFGVVAHSLGANATLVAMRDGLRLERMVAISPSTRFAHAMDKFAMMFKLSGRAKEALRSEIERRFGSSVWTDFAGDLIAAGMKTPALIFHDEQDVQVDITDAIALADAWRGARLVKTSGLGHQKILRDPEVISAAVRFMQEGVLYEPVDPYLTAATAKG